MMKIQHYLTSESGGAGIAARRLDEGLNNHNIDSSIITRSFALSLGNPVGLLNRCIHSAQYRITKALRRKILNSGIECFHDINSFCKKPYFKYFPQADIINLHWVADFINYKDFFDFFGDRNIVWTFHDMNPFLGGCHYFDDTIFLSEMLGKSLPLDSHERKDADHKIWEEKRKIFSKVSADKFKIVTPSQWLCKEAQKSIIMDRFDIRVIPNAINTDLFSPLNYKREYNKPTILFVADSISSKRKGFDIFLKALQLLGNDYKYIAIGDNKGDYHEEPIDYMGKITDEKEMSRIYSKADVFVIPSREDNLPNTVIEAISCGIPVIGSNVGGIPDMVRDGKTGFLFERGNSEDLVAKIKMFFELPEEKRLKMKQTCRKIAIQEYDMSVQARKYIQLYEEILHK